MAPKTTDGMEKKIKIKAWAITDWGGGIKHPSVSVFDTKKEACYQLKKLQELPDPIEKGEPNKVIRVEIIEVKSK